MDIWPQPPPHTPTPFVVPIYLYLYIYTVCVCVCVCVTVCVCVHMYIHSTTSTMPSSCNMREKPYTEVVKKKIEFIITGKENISTNIQSLRSREVMEKITANYGTYIIILCKANDLI
jgi:hypothetical protein